VVVPRKEVPPRKAVGGRAHLRLLPCKPFSPARDPKIMGATSSASYSAPSRRPPGQANKPSARRCCS
jgi:hypothetical protein